MRQQCSNETETQPQLDTAWHIHATHNKKVTQNFDLEDMKQHEKHETPICNTTLSNLAKKTFKKKSEA